MFLARGVMALRNLREVLGIFTGCFLNFVSPRIMKEIRSIPTARQGGEVLRELSEAAVSTSDPLPLVASSILVGRRQHPRDGGRGGGGEVRHLRHLDVLDDCVGLLFPESTS